MKVGNLEVAWGVVGRTWRNVVVRKKGGAGIGCPCQGTACLWGGAVALEGASGGGGGGGGRGLEEVAGEGPV